MQAKIQDVGAAPLNGRQEQYWNINIAPKFEKFRPGMKFKFSSQEAILKSANIIAFEYGHYTTQDERLKFLAASIAS